jgi:hypothetical protein
MLLSTVNIKYAGKTATFMTCMVMPWRSGGASHLQATNGGVSWQAETYRQPQDIAHSAERH